MWDANINHIQKSYNVMWLKRMHHEKPVPQKETNINQMHLEDAEEIMLELGGKKVGEGETPVVETVNDSDDNGDGDDNNGDDDYGEKEEEVKTTKFGWAVKPVIGGQLVNEELD